MKEDTKELILNTIIPGLLLIAIMAFIIYDNY